MFDSCEVEARDRLTSSPDHFIKNQEDGASNTNLTIFRVGVRSRLEGRDIVRAGAALFVPDAGYRVPLDAIVKRLLSELFSHGEEEYECRWILDG